MASQPIPNYDFKLLGVLLTPSWLSGMVCVLASLIVVGTIVATTSYQGSNVQQQIIVFQQKDERSAPKIDNEAVTTDYHQINDTLTNNKYLANLSVLIFWMFVGSIVYFIVTTLGGIVASAGTIEQELHYVHVRRKEYLRAVYTKLFIRTTALILWLLFSIWFARVLLPYSLAVAHVGGGNITSLEGAGYILLSLAVIAVCLHINLMMLRLVMLKPRLSSSDVYLVNDHK